MVDESSGLKNEMEHPPCDGRTLARYDGPIELALNRSMPVESSVSCKIATNDSIRAEWSHSALQGLLSQGETHSQRSTGLFESNRATPACDNSEASARSERTPVAISIQIHRPQRASLDFTVGMFTVSALYSALSCFRRRSRTFFVVAPLVSTLIRKIQRSPRICRIPLQAPAFLLLSLALLYCSRP
jgi:hypothetical protein